MSHSRPYFKWFISGGLVCAEGGPFLAIGIMFAFISSKVPASNSLRIMAIVFSIIGAASLCIGLPLLYKAVNERNLYLRHQRRNSTFLDTEEAVERPMKQAPRTENLQGRFCAICGNPLPNLPNIKFCPKCGEDIL